MSHGYYSHSYAEMQSSSRFCRKNGVCVVPTYPLGKAMNLFPRQKRDGKNPETQAAESVPLLAALATAQQVRAQMRWNGGHPPAGFFPSSPETRVSAFPKNRALPSHNSQVTVACTLFLGAIPLHETPADFCSLCSWSDFHSSFRHLFVKQAALSERAGAWKFSVIAETAQVSLNYPMLSPA